MSEPPFRIVQMPSGFDPAGIDFDCGQSEYNDWLIDKAPRAVKSGSASVYLMLDTAAGREVGYFSISPTTAAAADMPKKAPGGLMIKPPGYLIGKLALDRSLQGRKPPKVPLGPELVLAAIAKVVEAADRGGGQVIVVDADNSGLVPFYEGCGLLSTGIEGDLRLYMKVSTARKLLA